LHSISELPTAARLAIVLRILRGGMLCSSYELRRFFVRHAFVFKNAVREL